MPATMFSIKQPTDTTSLYTVSTQTHPVTISQHIQRAVVLVLRVLLLVLAGAVLLWQYDRYNAGSAPTGLEECFKQSLPTLHDRLRAKDNLTTRVQVLASACCFIVPWIVFRRGYTEESLLVIRGLGIQTSTSSSSYLFAHSTYFIPMTAIQDIFINEAFIGFKVKHYLTIVVENVPKAIVIFPTTLPNLATIEQVWRGTRACLYESKG